MDRQTDKYHYLNGVKALISTLSLISGMFPTCSLSIDAMVSPFRHPSPTEFQKKAWIAVRVWGMFVV